MQGRRGAVGSVSEVLDFEHGSTSSDGGLDQQNFWSGVSNSEQTRLPNFMVSSMDSSFQFSNSPIQQEPSFGGWDFGESSSSRVVQNDGSLIDLKTEHGWSAPINVVSDAQHFGPSNLVSMNNVHVDLQSDRIEDPLVQNILSHLPQDLNLNSVLEEDDDCQVIEFPNVYKSRGSRNQPLRFRNPSRMPDGTENYLIEENSVRAGHSSDGRRSSRKRKFSEGNTEQPSMVESSSYRPNISGSSSIAAPVENNNVLNFNLLPEPVNRRCNSSVRQMVCENPTLLANSGTIGSSSRNVRLRINSTHQQGSLASGFVSTENNAGNINPNSEAQPGVVHDSSPCRNLQSSRNAVSSLRRRNFSSISVSSERTGALFDDSNSRVLPRNISGYPMFAPPSDPGSSLQTGPMWGLPGGNVNNAGILGPTSESAIVVPPPSIAPTWIHQSFSQYQHRSSVTANSSNPSLNSSPLSQEMSLPSVSIRRDRQSQSRSAMLLERNPDDAPRIPNSLRALAAANGGRRRLMSEQLRNVLDLVRRGEGLRFEDMLLLQQSSIIFGMTDSHDQHRDMRLDVDNMSYEELLALEERIGSVSTGLSEETIIKQLKQKRVRRMMDEAEAETEPCCICQEEYNDGEDLGTLDCGHDFHGVCIKKWLMQKNLCPICKTTGLTK